VRNVARLGALVGPRMAPVGHGRLPRTVGRSAAMCGAAEGERIARESACSNVLGRTGAKPSEGSSLTRFRIPTSEYRP